MKKLRNKYPLSKKCVECGNEFWVNSGAEFRNVTCSLICGNTKAAKTRTGSGHPNWKGGKRIDRGYVDIMIPEHPFATKQGYVRKHRLVMEKKLGRYLKPGEIVHHKNKNKSDNRIRNLELCANGSEHAKKHSKEFGERMREANKGRPAWNKGMKLPPPSNYSGLMIKCLNCGTEKHYPPSTIKKGKGKFCSQGCAFDYRFKNRST